MTKNVYLLTLLVVLTACQQNQNGDVPGEVSKAVRVTTKTVMLVEESNEFYYSGSIEPSQSIALMFKSTGTVEDVFVDEGDLIRKGQALATVNKITAQNLYEASLASYEQAKDAYNRLKSVYDKGSLTEIKWVEMETKLKQAESQMLITRSNLEDCTLRAPDNGMIGRRNVEPGQSALGIAAPFELVKIDDILVKISVPENEISKIKKGMKAYFVVSAIGDGAFDGVISKVGIVAEKISRTYDVKILANNPGLKIKPGMVCDVRLQLTGEKDVVVVPARAVSMDDKGQSYVWLVNTPEKTVKKAVVKIGKYNQSGIEIYSGLRINDLVVVEGKEKLSENSSIIF